MTTLQTNLNQLMFPGATRANNYNLIQESEDSEPAVIEAKPVDPSFL
jgi:hypothetical protein